MYTYGLTGLGVPFSVVLVALLVKEISVGCFCFEIVSVGQVSADEEVRISACFESLLFWMSVS